MGKPFGGSGAAPGPDLAQGRSAYEERTQSRRESDPLMVDAYRLAFDRVQNLEADISSLRAEIQRERETHASQVAALREELDIAAHRLTEAEDAAEAAEQRLREVEGERDEAVKMAAADVSGSIEIGRLRSELAALRAVGEILAKWVEQELSAEDEGGHGYPTTPPARTALEEWRFLSPSTAEPANGSGAGNPDGVEGSGRPWDGHDTAEKYRRCDAPWPPDAALSDRAALLELLRAAREALAPHTAAASDDSTLEHEYARLATDVYRRINAALAPSRGKEGT